MARRLLRLALLAAALAAPAPARASNCAGTSTGLVPLTDLGTGTYFGFPGGLYGTGSNVRPPAHDAAGVSIAAGIVPLDTLGNPDPANGRIVLYSIGMSNTTQEFSAFVPLALSDPDRHPKLRVIDCAKGGQSSNLIMNPSYWFWDTVATRLRGAGSSPAQAQVVWLKEAFPGPSGPFPNATNTLRDQLGSIVRVIKQKLPNTKLCYLSSRIYAGYASSTLNPEPYAYQSGFAVKWLIDAQVAGEDSLNFDPGAGPVEAPWLAWGPYLWADGLNPRGDGLTWACADFSSDGTHPSNSGRLVVANALLDFFKSDATAEPWFLDPQVVSAPPPPPHAAPRLTVSPNPSPDGVAIAFAARADVPWRLEVLDLAGRRVRDLGAGLGAGNTVTLRWDGRDDAGRGARAGVYWVRLVEPDGARGARAVLLRDR